MIVEPTRLLRERKVGYAIPASDLTISMDGQAHFFAVKFCAKFTREKQDQLVEAILVYLENAKATFTSKPPIIPAVAQCKGEILSKLATLCTGVENEAGLRFAIADPILMLLCTFWNLKVCVCVCTNICE